MPKIFEKIAFHLPTGGYLAPTGAIVPYPSPGATPEAWPDEMILTTLYSL